MNIVKSMIRWLDRVIVAIGLVSGITIVATVVAITWEVVARYLFNRPTLWCTELTSSYLLPACIFLGAAYTLKTDSFVRIDLLYNRLSTKRKAVLDVMAYIAGLVMATTLTWRGWELCYSSYSRGETTASTILGWPIFPSQAMIWLGSLFLALELIVKLGFSIDSFFKSGSKS